MNHTSYIKSLFYSFLQNSSDITENIFFIRHSNNLSLELEDIEKIVGEKYKDGMLYHRFSKTDIKEPYEPFMNGIRYYYQKLYSESMTVEQFVDFCDVYEVHKEIFVSYLKTGRAYRDENIILSEAKYEKQRFIKSIINCINFIAQRESILFILNRFQTAALTTYDFISEIIKQNEVCDARFMIIYNELEMPPVYTEEKFKEIINKADERNVLFEWESDEEVKKENMHTTFVPNRRFFNDYLRKINNLYYMLAIDDAVHYISVIHERIMDQRLNIDNSEKFDFYVLSAMCDIIREDSNSALLTCDKLMTLYDKENEPERDYICNFLYASIHMMRVQAEIATKYALVCKNIAEKLGDERKIFKAEIVEKGAVFGGWRDVFAVDFDVVAVSEDFVEKLKKYNFRNTLAHYLIYSNDNDYESIKKMVNGEQSDAFVEGINIGRELDNTYFLLTAYTKYILSFTDKGFGKYTDGFYNEKIKIFEREENKIRLAHLYMGMGYSNITAEKYQKANELFINGIEILYEEGIADEVVEGIYNMAVNSISAHDYLSAGDYTNVIFKMLSNLGIQSIQICNTSKLYGLMGLASFKLGNNYRTFRCVDNMSRLLKHILTEENEKNILRWEEDLFLYYFLTGLLEKDDENYEDALENFKIAMKYFQMNSVALFYVVVEYVTEYYECCNKLGRVEEAEKIIEFGLNYCNENSFVGKSALITHTINNRTIINRPVPANFNRITLNDLCSFTYHIGKERQLEKRRKDIRFLASWQDTLHRDDIEYSQFIKNVTTTLKNYFVFDGILLLNIDNNKITEVYNDIEIQEGYGYEDIIDFFKLIKKDFMTNRVDKNFADYDKILRVFGESNVVTLTGVPLYNDSTLTGAFIGVINIHRNFRYNRVLMNNDDLNIVKTASIQLFNSLERISSRNAIVSINKKLNELAVTDMLTGLYNRQGFSKMIESQANSKNNITIMYADLDNFKYYNDTFGHDVGDIVLKEFARIFREVSENIGYAVRYGGDEFVVVLNNVNKDKAKEVADRIYYIIRDGFVDKIRKYMNKEVDIPKDKYVSCSIGIAISKGCKADEVFDTMKKADTALYSIKKGTKGTYVFWEDIKK